MTSLRGLAAMAVVLQHFSATAQMYCAVTIPSLVPHGYMAVDFFFVLSGFIMPYTYLDAFERDGMRAYKPFLLKRVGRLFPLCIAMVAVIVALGSIAAPFDHRDWFISDHVMRAGLGTSLLINVLNLQAFSNESNINSPSWSISVEMGAYLAFPVLARLLFHARRWVAAVYFIAGLGVLIAHALTESRLGLEDRSVTFDFIRCFAEFGFGMLAYRVYRSDSPTVPRLGCDAWTWTISAILILALLARVDLLIALVCPLTVLTWALNAGKARHLLSSTVPHYLGTISFSIYLVHDVLRIPLLALLKAIFPLPVGAATALAFAALGSLMAIPFAALAYRYVEQPGRLAFKRVAD